MQEYSRILIEEYCMTHNSAKSRRLQKLVKMSYDMYAEGNESEVIRSLRFVSVLLQKDQKLWIKDVLCLPESTAIPWYRLWRQQWQ